MAAVVGKIDALARLGLAAAPDGAHPGQQLGKAAQSGGGQVFQGHGDFSCSGLSGGRHIRYRSKDQHCCKLYGKGQQLFFN